MCREVVYEGSVRVVRSVAVIRSVFFCEEKWGLRGFRVLGVKSVALSMLEKGNFFLFKRVEVPPPPPYPPSL